MSNALQAIPTEHGLSVLRSAQKEHAITYELIGALTPDATELSSFHSAKIESSYYDENKVLTFVLILPVETDFAEYLHKITILDADAKVVIECATPKVALAKGIGGKVTLKAAITGEAGEIIFKNSEYITEPEMRELWLPKFDEKIEEHEAKENPHSQYAKKTDLDNIDMSSKVNVADLPGAIRAGIESNRLDSRTGLLSGDISLSNLITTLTNTAGLFDGTETDIPINTGINSCDWSRPNNGSGFWFDRNGVRPSGVNTLPNGNFAADADWVKVGSASISGGQAHLNIDNDEIQRVLPTVAGQQYQVSFEFTSTVSAGFVAQVIISDTNVSGTWLQGDTISADGVTTTYTFTFIAKSDKTYISWRKLGNNNAHLDNVSLETMVGNASHKNTIKNDAGEIVESGVCDWLKFDKTSGQSPRGISWIDIKERNGGSHHNAFDGLRGTNKAIFSSWSKSEFPYTDTLIAFTDTGFKLGKDSNRVVNGLGNNYVYRQALFTHIRWKTTNHGKLQVEAYNPITKEGMIFFIGSGTVGHKLSHSQKAKLNLMQFRQLTGNQPWIISDNTYQYSYSSQAGSSDYVTTSDDEFINLFLLDQYNELDHEYVCRYQCNSETWMLIEYDADTAGTFIQTKDVNGEVKTPLSVIAKRKDGVGQWGYFDTVRGSGLNKHLGLDTEGKEGDVDNNGNQDGYTGITIRTGGFELTDTWFVTNDQNGKYLALVQFDSNLDTTIEEMEVL